MQPANTHFDQRWMPSLLDVVTNHTDFSDSVLYNYIDYYRPAKETRTPANWFCEMTALYIWPISDQQILDVILRLRAFEANTILSVLSAHPILL